MRNWYILGNADGTLSVVGSISLPPVTLSDAWRVTWGPFPTQEAAKAAAMSGSLEEAYAKFQAPVPGTGLVKVMRLAAAQRADMFIGADDFNVCETTATFDYEAWSGNHDG